MLRARAIYAPSFFSNMRALAYLSHPGILLAFDSVNNYIINNYHHIFPTHYTHNIILRVCAKCPQTSAREMPKVHLDFPWPCLLDLLGLFWWTYLLTLFRLYPYLLECPIISLKLLNFILILFYFICSICLIYINIYLTSPL